MGHTMLINPWHVNIKEFEHILKSHEIEFEYTVMPMNDDIKYTFKDINDYMTAFNIYVDL